MRFADVALDAKPTIQPARRAGSTFGKKSEFRIFKLPLQGTDPGVSAGAKNKSSNHNT